MLHHDISNYNQTQTQAYQAVCQELARIIQSNLPGSSNKLWHAHPVWFIEENPIVGYSVQKQGVRLMFWSGRSFNDGVLTGSSRFQDASIFYKTADTVDEQQIIRWLEQSRRIQWDYKNVVSRKGLLEKLTDF